MDGYEVIGIFIFAVIGACVGSFVSLVSYRLITGDDIILKRSECPSCHTKLGAKALIPVVSWLVQKGRCRYCQTAISPRYPIIEVCMAAVFAWLVGWFGLNVQSILLMLMATALAVMIVTDLEHYIIPDSVHVALLLIGIPYRLMQGAEWHTLVLGALGGVLFGLILRYGFLYLRNKDALGWGDVKLFAVIGLWLDVEAFVPFLFFAGVMGIVTSLIWKMLERGPVFPFGPALAAALFVCVTLEEAVNGYWRLYTIFQ